MGGGPLREDGGQMTEVGGQKSEKTEDREVGSKRSEVGKIGYIENSRISNIEYPMSK